MPTNQLKRAPSNIQQVVKVGSGYRTACGSLSSTPNSTISCNVTVAHDENAVGLVEPY